MSRPVVAQGVSVHPSPNGRHVVIRLHDDTDAQAVLALVLMDPGTSRVVHERLGVALTQVATAVVGTGAVN